MVDSRGCRSGWKRAVLLLGIVCGVGAASEVWAQTTAGTAAVGLKLPAFDVVSIKANKTDSGRVSIHRSDGNFDALNVSLTTMILQTYGLKESQVFGLPSWADTVKFDIKAKVVDPDLKSIEAMTPEQYRAMLEPILKGHFGLTFHREKKELPVYELVLAKGGAKIVESTAAGTVKVNGVEAGNVSTGRTRFAATAARMSVLVNQLSDQLRRPVIDTTGLAGKYDLFLTWSLDDGGLSPPNSNAASIFTALQEQLGLKLQPGKAEVDTMVVDSATLPEED